MIAEWIAALTTPCPRPAREMGHLRELIAIGARHRRQRRAWAPHLEATRALIGEAAPGGDTVVVLGSGWLLDVPVEALAARYQRVLLVDLAHPRAARRRTRALGNVAHLAADVTGCVAAARRGPVSPPPPTLFLDDPRVDLVVSVNLLSQLPVCFLERFAALGVPEAEADAFARGLIERHLEWLGRLQRACLITDVERVWKRGPAETLVEDALHGASLPPAARAWDWEVAPPGELGGGLSMSLRVRGWPDLLRAR